MGDRTARTALLRKRMELRVCYMEHLREQGKEEPLAAVALSVADLRSWLAELNEVTDDELREESACGPRGMDPATAMVVLRHMRAMPPPLRSSERAEAIALCLEIVYAVATSEEAVDFAAQAAMMLAEGHLVSLMEPLIVKYGTERHTDETVLWRLLLIMRNLLKHAPRSTNYDEALYHEHWFGEFQDSVRLADIINAGLTSIIVGCRMEAVRVLHHISVYVSDNTAERVIEILLETATDEAREEAAQFIVAIVWEVIFLRPGLARRLFASHDTANANVLLESLEAPSLAVRRVSVHGAIRLISLSPSPSQVALKLVGTQRCQFQAS